MLQAQNCKICLVGDCLSGGGAERVHAFLSNYFADKGIDIHNVIVLDRVSYNFSGNLLNLGLLKNESNGFFNKFKRLSVLRKYIRQHEFDYIIDFRIRNKAIQDWIISKFIFTVPSLYTIHQSAITAYMPNRPWLTKAIYGNAYGIISITYKMKQLIEQKYNLKNVKNIYNPVDVNYINDKAADGADIPDFKYIIAGGRMNNSVKQFHLLIDAYANSVLPDKNIKLIILGEGTLKQQYIQQAADKGLADMIVFLGFQENPYIYMKNALFFVLSSKNEGLPMVLLEALACGTPVISFDCFTGPSEIISHENNGLLVRDQDTNELTYGMNRMATDNALYSRCKQNAAGSIEQFSLDTIGRQWLDYLKISTN